MSAINRLYAEFAQLNVALAQAVMTQKKFAQDAYKKSKKFTVDEVLQLLVHVSNGEAKFYLKKLWKRKRSNLFQSKGACYDNTVVESFLG